MIRKVDIYRASEGTSSGRIDHVGIADLEVFNVQLGTRIKTDYGNGTASDYIVDNARDVLCTKIGGRTYVLQESRSERAQYRVVIHHNNTQKFGSVNSVILLDRCVP